MYACDLQVHFPTLHLKHWFDFVVLFQHETFVILDSAYDQDSPFLKNVLNILVSVLYHFYIMVFLSISQVSPTLFFFYVLCTFL